jgi:murein DD-endopeptidase MepM/ murein hydrolase activator NlpD
MSDAEKEIGSLSKGVQELISQLKTLGREIVGFPSTKGMLQSIVGGAANSSGGIGQLTLGSSGNNSLSGALADVNVQNFLAASRQRSQFQANVMGGIQAGTGILSGAMAAMPDVAGTTARSTGYYNAGVLGSVGIYGPNGLAARGLASMAGGLQFKGADAAVANTLAAQGITAGGDNFYNIMRSTAGVTRLTNMGNVQAAAALGGLTAGGTSAALMRNFGVFTTNPNTSQAYSPSQIFAQLQDRLTMGGTIKPTVAQLNQQLHGGYLGQDLANSGLSADEQSIFFQGLVNSAKTGYKTMTDWANPGTYSALQKQVGTNPQSALYKMAQAQTGTEQAAMGAYVKGMEDAAVAVTKFQQAITNFLNSGVGQLMARGNASLQTAATDNAINGAYVAGSSVLGAGINIAGVAAQNQMLARMTGGAAALQSPYTVLPNGAVKGPNGKFVSQAKYNTWLASSEGKAYAQNAANAARTQRAGMTASRLGKGSIMALGGQVAGSIIQNLPGNTQGSVGSKIGNAISTAAQWGSMGMMLGSLAGPEGTLIGGVAGALIGGTVGAFSGGSKSTVNSGSQSPTGEGRPNLVAPVKAQITTKWGQVTDAHGVALWGGNPHKAIDYGVPTGTAVQASGDGKVVEMGSGSGDRSYGNYVIIDHGSGYSTLYAHLSEFRVGRGDVVKQGMVIALSGATGYVTGPHLHFEVRQNGQSVNPSSWLGAGVAAVAGNFVTSASNKAGSSASGDSGSSGMYDGGSYSSGASSATSGYNVGTMSASNTIPKAYTGAAIAGAASGIAGSGTTLGHASPRAGASTPYQGGPNLARGGGGNNVTINVTISEASADEARKFAQMVKSYLDKDSLTRSMGAL